MGRFLNSIRFRIWVMYIGFISLTLIFFFFNQVVALPAFYNFSKTRETVYTINYIKSSWSDPDLQNIVLSLAKEQDMMIQLWFVDPVTGISIVYKQDPNATYTLLLSHDLTDDVKQKLIDSNTGVLMEKYESNNRTLLSAATYVGTPDDIKGYIMINNYIEPLENTIDILRRQFFFSAFIILFVAFIVSAFVVMSISNPIIKISRSAQKLATGEFYMQVKSTDYAEIRFLAHTLNKASAEIAKTENLRRDLIANVSHDLKTPLTVIMAYAEMIRDLSGDNPEKREKHIQVIIDETNRLNALVSDMLDTSKLQNGVATLNLQEYNLTHNIEEVVKRFSYFTVEGNHKISTELAEGIYVKADSTKLDQALYNLINNAINHSQDDGVITVRAIVKGANCCRVEVSDKGVGIPKEQLPLIWEKYYKAEKSELHQRTTVGTGLGLSIVKGIFESHGFNYGVDSVLKKGSTFWFELPIQKIQLDNDDNINENENE